jgi:hypothetical protein
LKPKWRGRGDARAPLDEGNGGTGGASLPLPSSTGGHPMAASVRAVVARAFDRRRGGLAGPEGGGGPREEGKRERAGCKNF